MHVKRKIFMSFIKQGFSFDKFRKIQFDNGAPLSTDDSFLDSNTGET